MGAPPYASRARETFGRVLTALAGMLLAAALAGCSATRATSEWRDEGFTGKRFDDLLVIAIDDSTRDRRLFEDTFSRALREEGLDATSSWTLMPAEQKVDKESVRAAISGRSVGAVLVVHLVGTEEREVYHPPRTTYAPARYAYRYYGYYSSVYDYVYEPGYYTRHQYVKLETNLYDVASEALVWSMQSETIDPQTANELVDSLCETVIEKLRRHGLIGPAARTGAGARG